jgi:chromate transporter
VTEGPPQPTLTALAREMARLGLLGFGGVGPQSYHLFVERTRWLSAAEFAELSGVAQALPGANTVNLAAIVGDRWFGASGAALSVCALVLPPTIVALVLAALLAHVSPSPRFVAVECAIVAACAGLILMTAYRVFVTIARRRAAALAIGVVLAAVVASRVVSMPIATVAALAAGIAFDALWRERA